MTTTPEMIEKRLKNINFCQSKIDEGKANLLIETTFNQNKAWFANEHIALKLEGGKYILDTQTAMFKTVFPNPDIKVENAHLENTRQERKFISCAHCQQTTVIDFEAEVWSYEFYADHAGRYVQDVIVEYYRINPDGTRIFVGISDYVKSCPRCGTAKPQNKVLKAKTSKKHICGNDCRSAVSDSCTCSCGGENHGINHKINC